MRNRQQSNVWQNDVSIQFVCIYIFLHTHIHIICCKYIGDKGHSQTWREKTAAGVSYKFTI